MTMDAVKEFDIWFGVLFLVLGVIAILVGGVLGVYLIRRPPRQRSTMLFLLIPLSLGLPFSMLGGWYLSSGLAAQQLERRLLDSGISARARVVQVEQTYTRL